MSARLKPNNDHQRKTCSRIAPRTCFCLPSISGAPGCGPGLVRGTRLPACRICCLFTISNIRAAHPKGEGANLIDIPDQNNGGACRDRTDDLKLAKLPLSQLSYEIGRA